MFPPTCSHSLEMTLLMLSSNLCEQGTPQKLVASVHRNDRLTVLFFCLSCSIGPLSYDGCHEQLQHGEQEQILCKQPTTFLYPK